MMQVEQLQTRLQERFPTQVTDSFIAHGQLTIEVRSDDLHAVCRTLCDDAEFAFAQLTDICGVDYADYGLCEWKTDHATSTGFDRGVESEKHRVVDWDKPRFAVVYHLLSLEHNMRLRIRSFVDEHQPMIDSVINIWSAADWFEREAFDLFGIVFEGHPDLRRLLTDYGFIGHPFRKDFPVSGHVEVRYDAEQQRVVYEPVDIQPRVLVPKVIRDDNRYLEPTTEGEA